MSLWWGGGVQGTCGGPVSGLSQSQGAVTLLCEYHGASQSIPLPSPGHNRQPTVDLNWLLPFFHLVKLPIFANKQLLNIWKLNSILRNNQDQITSPKGNCEIFVS